MVPPPPGVYLDKWSRFMRRVKQHNKQEDREVHGTGSELIRTLKKPFLLFGFKSGNEKQRAFDLLRL